MRWLAIALCALSAACADIDAERISQQDYCSRVDSYNAGGVGHRDYKNVYEEWC